MAGNATTDEMIKAELELGKTIYEIADLFGISIVTVYKRQRAIEKAEKEKKKIAKEKARIEKSIKKTGPKPKEYIEEPEPAKIRINTVLKPFDLKVNDLIKGEENQITQKTNTYQVVAIYKHHFLCRKISGSPEAHWRVSFLISDYQMGLVKRVR